MDMVTPQHASRRDRRAWVLDRLREADGPAYDQLVREVAEAHPEGWPPKTSILAVRAVRALMWDGLVTTEPDESTWLTPAGWAALAELAGRVAS